MKSGIGKDMSVTRTVEYRHASSISLMTGDPDGRPVRGDVLGGVLRRDTEKWRHSNSMRSRS